MIQMIFIGIILEKLGMLNGWMLFWYIISVVIKVMTSIGEADIEVGKRK